MKLHSPSDPTSGAASPQAENLGGQFCPSAPERLHNEDLISATKTEEFLKPLNLLQSSFMGWARISLGQGLGAEPTVPAQLSGESQPTQPQGSRSEV